MNEEQQQIAILKAMGWTETEPWLDGRRCFERADSNSGWNFDDLPDYLNDLNAMHEAEKMLRKPMKGSDTDTIIGDRMHKYAELIGYAFDATAAQRAEAFLKTIGKWEEIENI